MNREGAVCWVEHRSADHRAAAAFYVALLGWDPVDESEAFVFLRRGGVDVGAAYSMPDGDGWLPYFASSDAEATVERAREAGGTVLREPTRVGDAGWSAWVADPEGTAVGIWQAGSHPGFGAQGSAGSVCRVGLHTRRAVDSEAFLSATFGLARRTGAGPETVALAAPGGEPVHLVAMDERWRDARAGWVVYFGVDDVPGTIEDSKHQGGSLLFGPRNAPGVGDFAVLSDPLSRTFGVVRAGGASGGHPSTDFQ